MTGWTVYLNDRPLTWDVLCASISPAQTPPFIFDIADGLTHARAVMLMAWCAALRLAADVRADEPA